MKSVKERKKEKRLKIEQSIEELQFQLADKVKSLKVENASLKEQLKKYEAKDYAKEISPENKKLSPEDKKLLLSSGGKKFEEDKDTKPDKLPEISKFNSNIKPSDAKEVVLTAPTKIEDKKHDPLADKLIEVQTSDYYTSLSDNEVDKIEIAFLDNIIKDKAIFDKLDYLANVKPISKIEFLKPQPKPVIQSNLGIGSGIPSVPTGIPKIPNIPSIPNIPNIPQVPNIPSIPNLSKTMPNQGNIPSVPNIPLFPNLGNKPKDKVELDKTLADVEKENITKDDIMLGDDTLYLGKFLFLKLFKNYLLENNTKQIPASVKLALSSDTKPLLKLKESYFIDNSFSFDKLDRYLLLGYNSKSFEGYLISGQVQFPPFNEQPTAFVTNNENDLKDYANFYNIQFDYQQYIKYALEQIMQFIKEQMHKYHTLDDIQIRLQYKYNKQYDEQRNILLSQFVALQNDINARTSKMRIEQIYKRTPKLAKDLPKAVFEYKEPEKKVEPKKEIIKEKKKERIMLLQALGINVKSKMEGDDMYAMQYEMQAKKLLKAKDANEVVEHLMTMAKGGLRNKGEKGQTTKDQDIAKILFNNLSKYSSSKQESTI